MADQYQGYDYWFRMEIEVRGTPGGRDRLSELITRRGWVVSPTGNTENGGATEVWIVEVGITGSFWGAALAARLAFHSACRQAPVSIDLLVQEPVTPDDPPRTRWLAHRPVPPAVQPDWLRRSLLLTRLFDTGREIFLPAGPDVREAARLATVRPLTAVHTPPHDALPRLVGSPSSAEQAPRPRQHLLPERIAIPVVMTTSMVILFLSVCLGSARINLLPTAVITLLIPLILGVPAFLLAARYGSRPFRPDAIRTASYGWLAGLALTGVGLLIGWRMPNALALSGTLIAAFLTGNGLRLLFRNLSWKATAAWLIPALIPLALSVLPVPGISLHTYYLDHFGASREEVFIPGSWQFIAAMKALIVAAGPLVVLGLLGYARHFHAFRTTAGLWVGGSLLCTALILTIGLLWGQVLDPAARAAASAAAEAKSGRQPTQYFGLVPHRVCLRPADTAAVPFQGATVAVAHPYVAFPVSGDWIRLWDTTDESSVLVKREHWQITESTAPACPVE
ncbi:hypothetical protein ACIPLC_24645 [Kitasatospora sp. NPDC086801]|uniref:hypothetical protein n=1 Tax=Kitasatospora sp. NPDC086801 TaxID=3364066 RepID=UPI0037F8CBF7